MNIAQFLFGPYPLSFQDIDTGIFISSLCVLVGAVLLEVLRFLGVFKPVAAQVAGRFKRASLLFGVVGLLWSAFRHENASYLNWRLWMVIAAIVTLVWLLKIMIYVVKEYKKDVAVWKKERIKKKYLRT